MIPFIIALIFTATAVIGGIYHTEISNEFNRIYDSNIENSNDEIKEIEKEYGLNREYVNKDLDKYNKSGNLGSSIYKLNENGKYLLKAGNRLNTDLYKSLKEFEKLGDSLSKKNAEKLNNLLEKYKVNIALQKEFMSSELNKRNCINKDFNNKNNYANIEKAAAEKAAAEKAAAEKAAAEKEAAEKAAAEKEAAEKAAAEKAAAEKAAAEKAAAEKAAAEKEAAEKEAAEKEAAEKEAAEKEADEENNDTIENTTTTEEKKSSPTGF